MATSIRITGLDGVVVEIGRLPAEFSRRVLGEMSDVSYEQFRQGAGRHTPGVNGTGKLYKSLFKKVENSGMRITVGHDGDIAPHAIFVLRPTRPHAIKPRYAKRLSWIDNGRGDSIGSGKRVFSRGVWHPGYRGDPYDENATQEAVRQFAAICDRAIKGT